MKYVIDRFEGDMAILENEQGETMDVACGMLPENVKEGDSLTLNKDGTYTLDETSSRRETINNLIDDLFV